MPARWRVVSDSQRSDLGPDGTFVAVRDITFELLDSGRKGMVTIALRNYYDASFVQAEIQQHADAIDAVSRLGG